MPFEPDNELESAMFAALRDPEAMDEFHALLAESTLLVPLHEGGEEAPREGALLFRRVSYAGTTGVPAFTSVTQLAKAMPPGTRCAELRGRELAAGWDDETPLLVNPGGELGLPLSAEAVARLAENGPA